MYADYLCIKRIFLPNPSGWSVQKHPFNTKTINIHINTFKHEVYIMKSVIITGASRGIGKAAALLLASEYEYMAICCSSSSEELNTVANLIRKSGCQCREFVGNVSDYSFVSDMLSTVISEAGSVNTLINNAGISAVGLFTDTTPDEWDRIQKVNLTSIYNTCHCTVPNMVHNKSGRIINVSSVWGLAGASCEVAYSASKGAINSFTKALAKELAPSGISVNAIAFGAVDTDMNSHLNSEEITALEEDIPYGRMASVDEAARCILNILHMPSYFTGEVVKFDGGWL